MNIDTQERAEFETWYRSGHTVSLARSRKDNYVWQGPQSAWKAWQAARAASQVAVPAGFLLAPVEPDGVMKDSGQGVLPIGLGTWHAADCYRAMIAARPAAPTPPRPAPMPCAYIAVFDRAAAYLEHYAKHLQEVMPDDLEAHPYIPSIQEAAEVLRAMLARAAAPTPLPVTPLDTARLDYLEAWRLRSIAAGFDGDTYQFIVDIPVRDQLDEAIEAGRAAGGSHAD